MALTLKQIGGTAQRGRSPDFTTSILEVTGDNAYPAGGYTITPASVGLVEIIFVQVETSTDGAQAVYDHANSKLKFFVTGGSLNGKFSESGANGVNGSVARLLIFGR